MIFFTPPGEILRTQMLDLRYHVLGLQEATKVPQMSSCSLGIIRIAGPAYGLARHIEIWVNTVTPYGYEGKVPRCFQEKQFRVLGHAKKDGSWVVFRAATPFFTLDFVVGHAPHDSHPLEIRQKWWIGLSAFLCARSRPSTRLICLLDANSRLGAVTNDFIGDVRAEGENNNSVLCVDFIPKHKVIARPLSRSSIAMTPSLGTTLRDLKVALATCLSTGASKNPFSAATQIPTSISPLSSSGRRGKLLPTSSTSRKIMLSLPFRLLSSFVTRKPQLPQTTCSTIAVPSGSRKFGKLLARSYSLCPWLRGRSTLTPM